MRGVQSLHGRNRVNRNTASGGGWARCGQGCYRRAASQDVAAATRSVAEGRLSSAKGWRFRRVFAADGEEGEAGTTVLLDEIDQLHYSCQARLLELLAAADGMPHGRDRKARVATTSGQELESEVHAGRFREDLYYRIGAVSLRLPPLRLGREDISVLTNFLLAKYAAVFADRSPR